MLKVCAPALAVAAPASGAAAAPAVHGQFVVKGSALHLHGQLPAVQGQAVAFEPLAVTESTAPLGSSSSLFTSLNSAAVTSTEVPIMRTMSSRTWVARAST